MGVFFNCPEKQNHFNQINKPFSSAAIYSGGGGEGEERCNKFQYFFLPPSIWRRVWGFDVIVVEQDNVVCFLSLRMSFNRFYGASEHFALFASARLLCCR